nr:hypothetical protein [Tanacetum cinerariifolium]
MDSILEDLVDEDKLEDPNDNLVDTIPEMFTDEHTLNYSSSPLYDDFDDYLVELEFDTDYEMDSILKDLVDEDKREDPNDNLVDTIPEMFTDEHTLNYSSSPLYDDFDDYLVELEFDTDYVYNDPFESKEEKIKESKLLIDELDPLRSNDFLPSTEYDLFLFEDFSEVDALPSTNNEDKVFNLGILIQENLSEVTI